METNQIIIYFYYLERKNFGKNNFGKFGRLTLKPPKITQLLLNY